MKTEISRHDSGGRSLPLQPGTFGHAEFRGERDEHRILLERWWGDGLLGPYALWAGMNPSSAEGNIDDLTIRKECRWTRKVLNLSRYVKVNAGTIRMTRSLSLDAFAATASLAHPDNGRLIAALAARAEVIVAATGAVPESLKAAAQTMLTALLASGRPVMCLGRTADGWPRHPSRLGYNTEFEDFSW